MNDYGRNMKNYKRTTLRFLLTADSAALKQWSKEANFDDLEYAQELLDQHAEQLRLEAIDLRVTALTKYPEAANILSQFTLKG